MSKKWIPVSVAVTSTVGVGTSEEEKTKTTYEGEAQFEGNGFVVSYKERLFGEESEEINTTYEFKGSTFLVSRYQGSKKYNSMEFSKVIDTKSPYEIPGVGLFDLTIKTKKLEAKIKPNENWAAVGLVYEMHIAELDHMQKMQLQITIKPVE